MSDEKEPTIGKVPDEIPQPPAVPVELVSEEDPSPELIAEAEEVKKQGKNYLDLLPEFVRKDMDDLIAQGWGAKRLKMVIEDRYSKKTHILPASVGTFHAYIVLHKKEILERVEAQRNLITSTKETLSDLKTVIDTTTGSDSSLENKKQVLANLFKHCEARIKLIEAQQGSVFFDSHAESILGSYLKEQRALVESMIKFQEELKEDAEDQFYQELEAFSYLILTAIFNAYKSVHGEQKFQEFKGEATESIKKLVTQHIIKKHGDKDA